jgi:AraC-like DNA-binding protein
MRPLRSRGWWTYVEIIAFYLHRAHSVALPAGSAVFVRRGTVAWRTHRTAALLDPNSALLFPQSAGAATLTAVGAPASVTIFYDPQLDFGSRASVRPVESSAFLEQFYLTLMPTAEHHSRRLAQLVSTLVKAPEHSPVSFTRLSYSSLMQSYVNAALAQPFKLDEVARAAALSVSAASRSFHREFGVPLRVYVRRLRLRTALARIAEYHDLSQVALELGFFDHAHFTRAFRLEFGITPSSWRAFSDAALGQGRTRHAHADDTTISA